VLLKIGSQGSKIPYNEKRLIISDESFSINLEKG
jgi:hypothetical protein